MGKRILVIGGSGYVGTSLIKELRRRSMDFLYTGAEEDLDDEAIPFDLQGEEDLSEYFNDNLYVIFLAAISSPDVCKKNPDFAYDINVRQTSRIIQRALDCGAKVLFASSDTVYGSCSTEVNEEDPTKPLDGYGLMKAEVENNFRNARNFKAMRFSYILSKVDKFLSYLQNCVKTGDEAEVFHPFERSVVYIEDVVDGIISIVDSWEKIDSWCINICGSELISRKDIATFYQQNNNKLQFKVVEPHEDFFTERAKRIYTRSLYLRNILGRPPWKIKDAITKEIGAGNE